MTTRARLLSRSQTGPVPLDTERSTARSSSASSYRRMDSIGTSGSNTPVLVTFVKPRKSNSQSQPQSLDIEPVSLTTFTSENAACSTNPSSSSSYIVQVHEFIFLASSESAAEILNVCQNNIHYFIDVSKKTSNSPMRVSKSYTCLHQSSEAIVAHPYFEGMPLKELFQKFQSVNDTIRKARNKAQRVLIYSEDGFSACQAFALAYNMQYYELSLDRALDNFERLKLKIELSDYLKGSLEKWAVYCEEKKMENAANTRRTEWKETRPATVDCGMKRVAWQ